MTPEVKRDHSWTFDRARSNAAMPRKRLFELKFVEA